MSSDEKLIRFDYQAIDTHAVETITDQMLLDRIKGLSSMFDVSGYGLLAELCKRFEKTITKQAGRITKGE